MLILVKIRVGIKKKKENIQIIINVKSSSTFLGS